MVKLIVMNVFIKKLTALASKVCEVIIRLNQNLTGNCSVIYVLTNTKIHQLNSRTSDKWPLIAAAAAMAGLTKWVRPLKPWRPLKFRLDVDAQRSPGESLSSFIARHIEQPGSRHSKPELISM